MNIEAFLDAVERKAGVEVKAKQLQEYHKERKKGIKTKTFFFYADAKTFADVKTYDNNKAVSNTIKAGRNADSIARFKSDKQMSKQRQHAEFVFNLLFGRS